MTNEAIWQRPRDPRLGRARAPDNGQSFITGASLTVDGGFTA